MPRVSLFLMGALIASSCALGDDGVNPRGDGSVPDAGGRLDAAGGIDAMTGCVPACTGGDVCVSGACVPSGVDTDMDGVPAEDDCDDTDASIGSTAERLCTTACGEGLERCTDGDWAACTAPMTCACPPGSACTPGMVEMGAGCGNCGTLERTCATDCTWNGFVCTGEGVCVAGSTETDTQACPGTCGNTQSRTRTCSAATCMWGTFGSFSTCVPCGPVCGDGMCQSPEMCSTCSDCQYGHLGSGENNDPCTGVPAETWRCVNSASWGTTVSQFCRDGTWMNFHLAPRDCPACVCSYSTACRQAGM